MVRSGAKLSQDGRPNPLVEALPYPDRDERIQQLLDHGADIDFQDEEGTVLYKVVSRGSSDEVDVFLRKGADVNPRRRIFTLAPIEVAGDGRSWNAPERPIGYGISGKRSWMT